MRVSNPGATGVPEPYRQGAAAQRSGRPAGAEPPAAGSDRVELSPEAQLIQRLQRELSNGPERTARLAALKQAIDAGQYSVPADRVAQRMLERGFGKG